MRTGIKWLGIFLLLIVMACSLTACGKSPKSEQGILDDLNASTDYIAPPIDVDECEIEKRRTDEEAGTDLIYLTVSGDNGEFECKRQLQQHSRQKGTATQERWLFPFFM